MSVTYVHSTPDAEALIVEMARVSNPSNAKNSATAPRLLRYLVDHSHWSPFEMASLCVRIETERDISAQILRHRSFSFQEFSTRYAPVEAPQVPTLRRQGATNRQSSTDDLPEDVAKYFRSATASSLHNIHLLYEEMLAAGVARETARRVLPLCSPTTLYMHGTVRSWLHYLALRTAPDTQLEHRTIALQCRDIFATHFPITFAAAFSA